MPSSPPRPECERAGFRVTYIDTPRGRFAALVSASLSEDGQAASGVVLCLHGFPDTPATFAELLPALETAGYRAVAPFLRGYAPSPLEGEYGPEALGKDLLALCGALGAERVIGHDWGALAIYAALEQQAVTESKAGRIRSAVTLAVPRFQAIVRNLPADPRQLLRSGYILRFQLPGTERWLRAHQLSYIDHLWRRWSPGLPLPTAHLAEVKRLLLQSQLAPLRHYRALPASLRRLTWDPPPTTTPLLYLAGADDGCMGSKMCRGQAALHGGRYAERLYPNAGHFLHLEHPQQVAADIIAWLDAT